MARTESDKRWLIGKNVGEEAIPPWGVCQIAGYGEPGCFGALSRDNEIYWPVEPIGTLMEEHQNAACCFFAGRNGIGVGGFGPVTRDFPATALHDGSADSLQPGQPCGPKEGKSWLSSEGHAFTCMGHDASHPEEAKGNLDGIHTILVSNEKVHPEPVHVCHAGLGTPTTLTAGDYFLLAMDEAEWSDFNNDANFEIETNDDGDQQLHMLKSGTFLASFSASITADYSTVAAGTDLSIELIQKRAGTPVATLTAMRQLDIDRYATGASFPLTVQKNLATYENVAFTHPLHVKKYDTIIFRNPSSCDISLKHALFSLLLITREGFTRQETEPTPP